MKAWGLQESTSLLLKLEFLIGERCIVALLVFFRIDAFVIRMLHATKLYPTQHKLFVMIPFIIFTFESCEYDISVYWSIHIFIPNGWFVNIQVEESYYGSLTSQTNGWAWFGILGRG